MILQTPDLTWQAYNLWTDNSARTLVPDANGDGIADDNTSTGLFYSPDQWGGRATRASYERPFSGNVLRMIPAPGALARPFDSNSGATPGYGLYGGEARIKNQFWEGFYTVVRWLERNGVNVSYASGRDVARDFYSPAGQSMILPSQVGRPRVFMAAGHDEYWTPEQRQNIIGARFSGVSLAFLTGNTMFWRTLIDLSSPITETHDIISRKDTNRVPRTSATEACFQPSTAECFTGIFADGRAIATAGPENRSIGLVSGGATIGENSIGFGEVLVSRFQGAMRFWRGTTYSSGTYSQPTVNVPGEKRDPIGHEWDEDRDNGFRPSGLIYLSGTPMSGTAIDGAGVTAEFSLSRYFESGLHSMVMYRHTGFSYVFPPITFHAGSNSIGRLLDGFRGEPQATLIGDNARMVAFQQGMVNLLADMGLPRPATLAAHLAWLPIPTSSLGPNVTMDSNAVATMGRSVQITGSATPGGAVDQRVAAVEVKLEGANLPPDRWQSARGPDAQGRWTFDWVPPAPGAYFVEARAFTDFGNRSTSGTLPLTVQATTSMHDDWESFPVIQAGSILLGQEPWVGTRFKADVAGTVSHIKIYNPCLTCAPFDVALVDLTTNIVVASGSGGGTSAWKVVALNQAFTLVPQRYYGAVYRTNFAAQCVYQPGYSTPHKSPGLVADSGLYTFASNGGAPIGLTPHPAIYGVDVLFTPSGFWAGPPQYRGVWGGTPSGVAMGNAVGEVEVGSKFKASTDGFVSGVRVRHPGPPAVHVTLWARTDTPPILDQTIPAGAPSQEWTRLASVAVESSSATGTAEWTQAYFPAAVKTFANVEYVVSMHASQYYEADAPTVGTGVGPLIYLGPVSQSCVRDSNGFCGTPQLAVNPQWGTPLPPGRHVPVDPLFMPTDAHRQSLWSVRGVVPMEELSNGTGAWVATRFTSKQPGVVDGVRFFSLSPGSSVKVRLFDVDSPSNSTGVGCQGVPAAAGLVACADGAPTTDAGTEWRTVRFNSPVPILANRRYRAAYDISTTGLRFGFSAGIFSFGNAAGRILWVSPREGVLGGIKSEYSLDGSSWQEFTSVSGKGSYFVDVAFRSAR